MPAMRQLPQLTMRGSIASQTMKNLTPAQCKELDKWVRKISKCKLMQGHKHELKQALSRTIRSDYAEDPLAVECEFDIAIWKGLVELLFHVPYTYQCNHCGATEYLTQQNKKRPIDRQRPVCPACNVVEVDHPGDTDYVHGQFVDFDEFQASYAGFNITQKSPISVSPIKPIAGVSKYPNPRAVLKDKKQRTKFFKEFVWGYFRQQLNENTRVTHNAEPKTIVAPLHKVLVEQVIDLCIRHKVTYTPYLYGVHDDVSNKVYVNGFHAPPEFTIGLMELQNQALDNKVEMRVTDRMVEIFEKSGAELVESTVTRPEIVCTQDNAVYDEDNSLTSLVDQLDYKSVRGIKMLVSDQLNLESADMLAVIQKELPDDGLCRPVLEIFAGIGPAYAAYSAPEDEGGYGNSSPKMSNMAKLLNCSVRDIQRSKKWIAVVCLRHHVTAGRE